MPVDYVAGTSMGSLVGGFYATGMTAEQLEATVRAIDFETLFKDSTARKDEPYLRKLDDNLGLFGPKVGIGPKSQLLAMGAISGQKISFLFQTLTSRARAGGQLRQSADPLSRDGDRHRHRRRRGDRPRQPRRGDAREHVGAGRVRSGTDRPVSAGRRRPRRQRADRRRAQDGRRHRHRGRCRYAARTAREPHLARQHHRTTVRSARRAQRQRADRHADGSRRADQPATRFGHHVVEFRPGRQGDPDRLRGRQRETRRSSSDWRSAPRNIAKTAPSSKRASARRRRSSS